MAIFDSVLFRRVKNSVGNVTTYVLNNQNVVRAKCGHHRDRKSLLQLKQRVRMKAIQEVCYFFYPALQVGFCCSSLKEGVNRFVKANVMKIGVDDELKVTFDWLDMAVPEGPLGQPALSAELDAEANSVLFCWERQALMPYAFDSDLLYGVVSEVGEMLGIVIPLGTRGVAGRLTWGLPDGWDIRQVVVHGFARNVAGSRTSGSLGLVAGKGV